jgi:hypothetical protein
MGDSLCRCGTKVGVWHKGGGETRTYAGSMVASSTSMTGMLSRTGYTLRHSPHLRLFPLSLTSSGFLHTGQTKISKSSLSIMGEILRLHDSVEKVNGTIARVRI